ncbi:MAG: CAP domain-containing protein [Pyrinomonadaceae bacterium]|nr:CAP domain-containing protein [Pyrinomonadaceae bacterium]
MKIKLSVKAMLASAVFSVFSAAVLYLSPTAKANVSAPVAMASGSFSNIEADELEIFELVNRERRKKGLSNLYWDDDLSKMARNYSKKMARGNFFSHYDEDGESVIERAAKSRVSGWRKIGENLFYCEGMDNYQSVAVKGWLRSASHRQNMLDRSWTDSGIGIAKSRNGRVYVTQVFIKR